MNNVKNTLAILVASYEKGYYRWAIMAYFLQKYWPNCSYPIFLGANGEDTKTHCPNDWQYLNIGPDNSWRASMQDYLNAIESDYVLVLVDDTALVQNVDNEDIELILSFMNKKNAVMCRLNPRPGPDYLTQGFIGRIAVEERVPYITSWTNVIWDRKFLLQLLDLNYNPWEFEIKAGKSELAMQRCQDFYACTKPVIDYFHFVEKDKYDPKIFKLLAKENIKFDRTKYKILSTKEVLKLRISAFLGKAQRAVLCKYQNKFRKLFGLKEL